MTKSMNKILTYTLITFTILGLSGLAINNIQAQGTGENYSRVTEELAERFGLNADEVREYFNENRGERMFERLTEVGLTEEQVQVLRAKKEELREARDCLSNLSFEERQVRAEEMRTEMKEFAEQNGIDLSLLGRFGGSLKKGFRKGFGKGLGKGL